MIVQLRHTSFNAQSLKEIHSGRETGLIDTGPLLIMKCVSKLTFCMLGNFSYICSRLLTFFSKLIFSRFFANSLDADPKTTTTTIKMPFIVPVSNLRMP